MWLAAWGWVDKRREGLGLVPPGSGILANLVNSGTRGFISWFPIGEVAGVRGFLAVRASFAALASFPVSGPKCGELRLM